MELTTFSLIALLFGAWTFLYAIPAIFAPRWFEKEIIMTVKEKPGLDGWQLHSTIIALFGVWVLSVEYRLDSSLGWGIVIPILGYLTVFKGILGMWAPKFSENLVKKFYTAAILSRGIIWLAMTVFMWWLAFSVF